MSAGTCLYGHEAPSNDDLGYLPHPDAGRVICDAPILQGLSSAWWVERDGDHYLCGWLAENDADSGEDDWQEWPEIAAGIFLHQTGPRCPGCGKVLR